MLIPCWELGQGPLDTLNRLLPAKRWTLLSGPQRLPVFRAIVTRYHSPGF